ncbi:hypothetical protein [Fimbriiglobus ruber]|uniref:Uncharacterized protein n=1 Tax=Fimbriiglobus ruber TaxID=1908690 RepID=A0A225CZK4_9BACT|nr:hypothetical protein [Fimbriiglobus ruber]OWK34682.1 hypothetical protein FRUB_09524 [Fimbriiglobus ruber]
MDSLDTPPAPAIDPAIYDRLRASLETSGPLVAVDRLCDELRKAEDFQNLFYARLMRKRIELGLSPFPTGPSTELPPETHEAYENTIREAGREIGHIYLERRDIPKAWVFFRMLGEPGPVKEALAKYQPGPDDDAYPVVEVAWQHAVLPEKGFDIILDRHGVCSAITMVHSADLSQNPAVREYCVKRLVRALHEQLLERLRGDLEARGTPAATDATIPQILAVHPDICADDAYHIDVSHLSSVVQLAIQLSRCPELELARDLCEYGVKLSPGLRGNNDPPFEDTYVDYLKFLDVLTGRDVEGGLAHFRDKLPKAAEEGYQFPAEVMVNLLLKADRLREALQVAREYLPNADERQMSCPGVTELARRAGDFDALADAARTKADPVNYLAGLIAAHAVPYKL